MDTLWDWQDFIVERRCLLHMLACLNLLLQLLLHAVECLSAGGVVCWRVPVHVSSRQLHKYFRDSLSLPSSHALDAPATPKLHQTVPTNLMVAVFVLDGKPSAPISRTKQLA